MNARLRTIGTVLLCASSTFVQSACGAGMSKASETPAVPDAVPAEALALSGSAQSQMPSPAQPSRAKTEVAQLAPPERPRTPAELLAYEASVTVGVYQVEQA